MNTITEKKVNTFSKEKRQRLTKIYISQIRDQIDISDFLLITDEERKIIKTKFKEIQDILIKADSKEMIKYLENNFSKESIQTIKYLL